VWMLDVFLHKQETEILLLQEVTHYFDTIRRYNAYVNIGINNRGPALPTREQIKLTNITRLPSERGVVACYRGVWLLNIYAPSSTANRHEGKLLQHGTHIPVAIHTRTMISGGDFNCVLSQAECTGNLNYSKALDKVVRRFGLIDAWGRNPPRAIYTHYPPPPRICHTKP